MADDPERLVTDALRAQATSTNAGFVAHVPIAEEPPAQMSVWWILGLALMLGLAAGTVAAVITLS
ncbi:MULTISPECIES: hypothetical protein [Lentzea]|uniref:Uncharacterized protein n=1 Tax=Lentzea pudingi TaxID=1789439 RepID=A0ABQ2IDM3_9PSEU|nr:hypothetical protein [Lentzea pudingi]GGN05662.1 hypothetical protein GCM10011609_51170 [Lentzea pudingi]